MKSFLNACIISIVLPIAALAEDYRLIGSNKAQMILADADGAEVMPHNLVKLWSIVLRAPDHLLIHDIAILKAQNEFDCTANKVRLPALTTYHKDYSLIDNSVVKDAPWRPIVPDTQNAELKEFACGPAEARKKFPGFVGIPLGKIISSVYAGPWPSN